MKLEQVQIFESYQTMESITNSIWEQKLNRLRQGCTPRVLDLFSGCGGLSLGFQSAGFDIVGAIEIDPIAIKSHAVNFYKTSPTKLDFVHFGRKNQA